MQVTISGSIGRAPQSLPQTTDGLPVLEAALAVPTGDGKNWFAIQFVGTDLVEAAQVIRKGDTIAIAGYLTFEPLPDGAVTPFKPVVAVSDLQSCDSPIAY
jgi:single-stranded DNA-binding protein